MEGKDLPLLYTISRDGAIFSWKFTPKPKGGAKPPSVGDAEDEEEADEEPVVENPSDFPFLGRGTWSLSEKHYLHQRGAKVGDQQALDRGQHAGFRSIEQTYILSWSLTCQGA